MNDEAHMIEFAMPTEQPTSYPVQYHNNCLKPLPEDKNHKVEIVTREQAILAGQANLAKVDSSGKSRLENMQDALYRTTMNIANMDPEDMKEAGIQASAFTKLYTTVMNYSIGTPTSHSKSESKSESTSKSLNVEVKAHNQFPEVDIGEC